MFEKRTHETKIIEYVMSDKEPVPRGKGWRKSGPPHQISNDVLRQPWIREMPESLWTILLNTARGLIGKP
jgi:hypothetical protein